MKASMIIVGLLAVLVIFFVVVMAQGPGDAQFPNTRPGNRTNDGMPGVTGDFKHNSPPVDTTARKGVTGVTNSNGKQGVTGPTGNLPHNEHH